MEIQTHLPETTEVQTQLPETTEVQTQLPETQLPETTMEIQTQLPETTKENETQLPETTMKTIKNKKKRSKNKKQHLEMQKLGINIKQIVWKFKKSKADVYRFDTYLNAQQRSSVHNISNNYGLISKSVGKGLDRRLSIYKMGILKNEENLVYLKFSDEPKEEPKEEVKNVHKKKRKKEEVENVPQKKRKKEEVKNQKNLASSKFSDESKEEVKDQENLVSFRFSDKSKEVLKDLFSRYPPDEYERKKNNVVEGSGETSVRRGFIDQMFHETSMTTSQIAKKMELLASKTKESQKLRQITELRSKLPIASFKDVITSTTLSHQVVLICGETGCGKTTQVPQFLLDDAWSKDETCKIVCTQPRRISAMSVAERIASERGESVGDTVGYKIRLESKGGRNSSLVFCTSGVLLNVVINSRSNERMNKASSKDTAVSHITHIIVDEIHERDRYTDFMLAMIRDILPSNPHLHLVLMSATLDAERFSVYFGGCPIIRVPGFTYPVKSIYLNDLLSELRSTENTLITSTQDNDTKEDSTLTEEFKIALDESIDLAMLSGEFDALLALREVIYSKGDKKVLNHQTAKTRLTPLMVFATKGRVSDICLLLSCGVDCTLQSSNGKTALHFAEQSNQEEAAEIIKKHMEKTSTSEEFQRLIENSLSRSKSGFIDCVLIEQLLMRICADSSEGAILIFLPGWDDIRKTQEKLVKNPLFNDSSKFVIIPLHSMIPPDDQKKVFERPPQGCRKIVLSTNIAETSITVDDVVYVIDSGIMKEKNYDPYSNEITLQSNWISKASMKQREGRAGRCQPGICYHLYSKSFADSLPDFQVPEIMRMPIDELCLQVKLIDPSCKIEEFLKKTLDPPIPETVRNAIIVLQATGALTLDEELTDLGRKLGSLPLHPLKSRMLFVGILLDCLDTALTLVCASEYRDPFILPRLPDEKKKASDAKSELASFYGGTGDQLAVLAAYECWVNTQNKAEFCRKYFISSSTMCMISRIRRQLKEELHRNGFIGRSESGQNNWDLGIIQAVLVSGIYPKVGKCVTDGRLNYVELVDEQKVRLGNASITGKLPKKNKRPQTLIAYDELIRTDRGLSIRNSNIIGSLPFLLLAREIAVAPLNRDVNEDDASEEDRGKKIMSSADNSVEIFVDRWFTFESTALDAAQIYYLRERLSAAIMLKILQPEEPLPEHLEASVSAITYLLSYDGMLGMPLELGLGETCDISEANQVDITSVNKSEPHQIMTSKTKLKGSSNFLFLF